MNSKFITNLGSVIEINPSAVSKHYPHVEIEYVDISSVGTGFFAGATRMPLSEAPSRAKRLVEDGDTILATVRPNLRSFLYIKNPPSNMVVSTGFVVLHPGSEIDTRFLYYTVTCQKFTEYLSANVKGAAYPAVDTETFARAEIWLPDLLRQKKIAAILSAYDDLIENNTQRIQILEQMAQAIYREWFVHFRFPGHEKVKLVESPLGKIPQEWQAKNLGDMAELAYGKALKAEQRMDGPYPVYGSSGVVGHHNEALVKGPGVIVGRKGNIGSVFWSDDDFYPIDTVFFVRSEVPLHYVFYNLKHQTFLNNDAAVPGLNRNAAYMKSFIVPDGRTLSMFQSFVEPIFKLLRFLSLKNTNLRRTRDLLLPKLISGELDISKLNSNFREPNYDY